MLRNVKPVTLAVFNSREEAEPMRQLLCEAGIWSEVRPETDIEELLQFGRAATSVKVEVPREDFEQALQLLYEWNGGEGRETPGEVWLPWVTGQADEQRGKRDGPR